jgi:hypothetical protein
MGFASDVVVREIDDETWELTEALVYKGNTDTFVVKNGFRTDFASVPRAFVWLIPSYGRYTKAAILHDFLCEESKAGRFDRNDADGIFRRAMRELGVSFLRRWMMWGAVSLATQWIAIRHGHPALKRIALLIVIGLPATLFFVVPAAVITVWLLLFWILELVVWLVWRPFAKRKMDPPRFIWKMS